MSTQTRTVRVRNVSSNEHFRLAGNIDILRVPYDFFVTDEPVLFEDGFIHYQQYGGEVTGAAAHAHLAECKPGERVLIQVPPTPSARHWWLCEIEEVEGTSIA